MREATKPSLRHRAVEEFKELLALTAYLYVCLGAVILLKSAILHEVGISFDVWGIAIVKAVVLAKFMLLGRAAKLGQRYKHQPLIWPTLHMAFLFLLLLLVLTTLEEIIVGLIHGRALADSLAHVVGPNLYIGFATCLVLFLILVPYCAFKVLGDVLGDRYIAGMFFIERIDKRVATTD